MVKEINLRFTNMRPKKLYTKLVISYLLIVVMSVTMLYMAISEINVKSIQKQAIEHNHAMLLSVCDAYKQKCRSMKTAVAKLYMDSITSSIKSDIWRILEGDVDQSDPMEYKRCKTSIMAYLREESLNEDSDLMAASIVVSKDEVIIRAVSETQCITNEILA